MKPTQCTLWKRQRFAGNDIQQGTFESVRSIVDESHLVRELVKCTECGQLYFYEFVEIIDWVDGNDDQYVSLIPVGSEDEALNMAKKSPIELFVYSPRLLSGGRGKDGVETDEWRWIGWSGEVSDQSVDKGIDSERIDQITLRLQTVLRNVWRRIATMPGIVVVTLAVLFFLLFIH